MPPIGMTCAALPVRPFLLRLALACSSAFSSVSSLAVPLVDSGCSPVPCGFLTFAPLVSRVGGCGLWINRHPSQVGLSCGSRSSLAPVNSALGVWAALNSCFRRCSHLGY